MSKQCSVEGCTRVERCKRLCNHHYFKEYDGKRRHDAGRRLTQKKFYHANPGRQRAYERKYRAKHRDRLRSELAGRRYGKDKDWFSKTIIAQGNLCAMCGEEFGIGSWRPCVDHHHASNTARAILHHNCNTALGLLKENPERCRRAAEYLEKFIVAV
jgi:hypothetical protein